MICGVVLRRLRCLCPACLCLSLCLIWINFYLIFKFSKNSRNFRKIYFKFCLILIFLIFYINFKYFNYFKKTLILDLSGIFPRSNKITHFLHPSIWPNIFISVTGIYSLGDELFFWILITTYYYFSNGICCGDPEILVGIFGVFFFVF